MIYSNDYVDLLVNNYGNGNPRSEYLLDSCVNEIIDKIAIYHGRRTAQYLTNLEAIPYSSIPKLYGLMDSTNMDAIGVKKIQNPEYLGLNGAGTIVGIIDTGILYDNPLFFNANGQSRIGVIWDQTIPSQNVSSQNTSNQNILGQNTPSQNVSTQNISTQDSSNDDTSILKSTMPPNNASSIDEMYKSTMTQNDASSMGEMTHFEDVQKIRVSYGTVYTREQINLALASENPYSIVPSKDTNGHGTFLAGIAAGGVDQEQSFTGIATEAEIAVVKLKETKPYLREYFQIQADVPAYEETDIIYAIQYLVQYARNQNKPISILLGVGSSNGGHRGHTYLEIYLSRLLENVGVMVSVSAGNEGASRLHYYGKMESEEQLQTVELNVEEGQKGVSIEFWGEAPSLFALGIISPRGERLDPIPPRFGKEEQVVLPLSNTTVYVAYQIAEAYSGEELVFVRIVNPTPGIWRLQVHSQEENEKSFHMWMPLRQFLRPDTFFLKSSADNTITSPGNADLVCTITAYNHLTESLYLEDSRGYTANAQIKPDLAAPGVAVMGPGLYNNYVRKSGTSVAAAHAAGVCALFQQWDMENYREGMFFTGQVQSFLLRGAKRSEDRVYPDPGWGYGVIDIEGTVRQFLVSNYTE